jgi:hypothetical protein
VAFSQLIPSHDDDVIDDDAGVAAVVPGRIAEKILLMLSLTLFCVRQNYY